MSPRESGPSPEEIGNQSEVENLLNKLFDKSKREFGEWWKDQPNTERIKDLVKRRISDSRQREEPASETPGGMFMRREMQKISELRKRILEIVQGQVARVTEFDDRNKPVTEELYDSKIFPIILRELQREDIQTTEESDASIILEEMKSLFIGLSYNDLHAAEEVYGIVYRKTHKNKLSENP